MLLKHSILVKVFGFVAVLLVTKAAIHQFELDLVTIGPLVTAFVGGGVIFIIAIILACTLSDYKVKKIPLELAASILILYKDVRIASIDNERINTMRDRIRLLSTINYNFKSKVWKQTDVNLAMDEIDEDIVSLAQKGTRPQFIVRLRNELANIDRISNCIETIKETTFIRAAFSVAN
ncbi:MAG: hypothetical protein QOA14_02300 [Nitrososphaeraceae archaeon]|nr:hypothetical protein [Nitrososphaeraceae archaeon]MDW0168326.1 hypothetical protein [Nitrososphaeraceae archaeon]MDW0171830.1 hypothetical protein [Nitrososphaeraceae archaeon]MDW0173296.1 hypothetical protein [Nitrososphaeraceae archaeon]MDW0177209.1 hypothetical protein [Nitrososphaeraceae archaeon]